MNDILIVKLSKPSKGILEDSLDHHEGQVLLGKSQEMTREVVENKHRLARDGVHSKADMTCIAM